jgi:hypothetical protein
MDIKKEKGLASPFSKIYTYIESEV